MHLSPTPLLLHLLALPLLALLPRITALRSPALRLPLSILLLAGVLALGWGKVQGETNLFKMLGIGRDGPPGDIQRGLDRLEGTWDAERVMELEEKLIGKTAQYHWKGHDLFGDSYPPGEFDARLSTAREQKTYKVIADSVILFYSTFIIVPASMPRRPRLFLFMAMGAGTLLHLALYETHPELASLGREVQKRVFQQPIFRLFTVYQLGELLTFILSGTLLATVLFYRLSDRGVEQYKILLDRLAAPLSSEQWSGEAQEGLEFRWAAQRAEDQRQGESKVRWGVVVAVLVMGSGQLWERYERVNK